VRGVAGCCGARGTILCFFFVDETKVEERGALWKRMGLLVL
jgi:hypothetical protein